MKIKTIKLILFAKLLILPIYARADYPKNDLDFAGLPEFCAPILSPKLQGSSAQKLWGQRLSGFDGPHHYCAGLFTYNLAWKTSDKWERASKLNAALTELTYPLDHHFNPQNPLSAKLMYDIAKVYEAKEEYDSAMEHYQKSIELNPKIWIPYAALSDLQKKLNNPKGALDTIQNGLKHKPDSKPLLKRLNKLK
ncbi:tetratricopeptide repeat protein [Methylomonas sp. MK1]|uniref:tetratricopeptide repeat protein n=1 Tax=Methylomonas sp. MK1 TaxID=1131552 RepID=UPI0003744339|nr:tetratricopeptide repeat protein [Methylomonas sp. MK1]